MGSVWSDVSPFPMAHRRRGVVAPLSDSPLVEAPTNHRVALQVVVHRRGDLSANQTEGVQLSGEPGLSVQATPSRPATRLTTHATPLAR